MENKTRGNILIVDDDPAIRKVVGISLRKSGYEVGVSENGAESIAMIRDGTFTPDCIILDYRMPKMSGLEVLSVLKKEYPIIPVIMLTALTDLEIAVDTMKEGAFDYIVKPVRKLHLVESIKKAIRYRDVLIENKRLARENDEYQKSLEKKVTERTEELILAYKKLKNTNLETVKILAETIEAKDPYTRGHCNRVRLLSSAIARNTGMDKDHIETLEYGALLHDIGKIGIKERLLNKRELLTHDEERSFQLHTVIGENILKTVVFFKPCLTIIRSHHEWYDGSGYPDQLRGDLIDPKARIVALSDAFDAMTSTRPYRKALPLDYAISELINGKGKQFDPSLVDIFIEKELYTDLPITGEQMRTVS
jgi:putative two-component system response regulator